MKRTWTIIGVGDVLGSFKWYQALFGQPATLPAAWIVSGSLVNSGYFTIRKGDCVEARRLMRVFVEPEADRVLWLHVRVLLLLDQGERRSLYVGPYQ